MSDTFSKLQELIQSIGIAMLTTVDQSGTLRSRPMAVQKQTDPQKLWFFTRESAPKVTDIQKDERVNIAFSEPKNQQYVSVSGTATVVRDQEQAKQLWSPMLKAFFPKGLEDPELALLQVQIDDAEYWDAPSGKMVQLIGMAKAVVSGKPYQDEGAEHAKVKVGR